MMNDTWFGGWIIDSYVNKHTGGRIFELRKKVEFNTVLITIAKAKDHPHPKVNPKGIHVRWGDKPCYDEKDKEEILLTIGQNVTEVWSVTDIMDMGFAIQHCLRQLGWSEKR